MTAPTRRKPEPPDLLEHGVNDKGEPTTLDRRLYCQLQVFTGAERSEPIINAFAQSGLQGSCWLDAADPSGIAFLVMSEDPAVFTTRARAIFTSAPFHALKRRPELTMFGRTYSSGREQDLEWWMTRKPLEVAQNKAWPWMIWYPLRRRPEFALLPPDEMGKILYEHAMIGMGYGEADAAHDIRLACHGLDENDNEFIIGLHGKDLHPLSRIVQEMRKTQQTAKFIQSLGPFFVGRAAWQAPVPH